MAEAWAPRIPEFAFAPKKVFALEMEFSWKKVCVGGGLWTGLLRGKGISKGEIHSCFTTLLNCSEVLSGKTTNPW